MVLNSLKTNRKWNPVFPSRLFWDVDAETIDYKKHGVWVVRRVFERGNLDDIMELLVYYGNDQVAEVLKNTRGLKRSDMNLVIMMFHLKPNDFVCYRDNCFHSND